MHTLLPFSLLLALLAAGCSLPSRSPVPVRYYTLEPNVEPPKEAGPPAVPALAVARLDAPSHYDTRIFYRKDDHTAGYYEHDRWIEPPAALLSRLLRQTLRDRNVAQAVASDTLLRDAHLLLTGELLRFDVLRDARDCSAQCELQLVIRDLRRRKVLFAQRFHASRQVPNPAVPMTRPKVPAMVGAMNEAVGEVLAQSAHSVAKALADLPKASAAPPQAE
jgi:ABC-type uncharacterized transport system auxiliary subunit